MTRNEVLDDARDTLSVEADCPFAPPSDALVLRCPTNRKWFAILLRRAEGELLCIRAGALTGSLLAQPGFVPAYHMNKEHWISIILDGSMKDVDIRRLIEESFALTAPKTRIPRIQKSMHHPPKR